MTVEEYLAFDAAAPEGERYEYWDGVVVPVHAYDETGTVAMAGASPEHNQIAGNLAAALHGPMTARGCRMGVGDQRVRTETGRYSYPDLVHVRRPQRGRVGAPVRSRPGRRRRERRARPPSPAR